MRKKLKLKIDFSTGGVVWDSRKRKVLMIYVKNLAGQKVWTFPKGHPDKGEGDREAALREVREETGWTCEIARTLMNVHYQYIHKNVFVKKTVRWFLMTPLKKTGNYDPREIIRVGWFTRRSAWGRVTYKTDKDLLLKLKGITRHSG